jgi:hypothetical protein
LTRQVMYIGYNVTFRLVAGSTVAVEKAIYITYSGCVFVALVIQHIIS